MSHDPYIRGIEVGRAEMRAEVGRLTRERDELLKRVASAPVAAPEVLDVGSKS
jgi:hypothetical protein